MSKRIYVGLEIEGFETPVFVHVEFKGFVDPIIALEKMGVFERSLTMKARIEGSKAKPLTIRTDPRT